MSDLDYELPVLAGPQPWMVHASCRGAGGEVFFPTRGEPTAEAKAICAGCPVRAECLTFALESGEKYGIWGGRSERERRKLRKVMLAGQPRAPRPINHGSTSGYATHLKRGEVPCDSCRRAHAAYHRDRKARARLARQDPAA